MGYIWYNFFQVCDSKVISRATLEIKNNVNSNKPFNHKSNAPQKQIAKWKNLYFDEHFHANLAILWSRCHNGAAQFKGKRRIFGQLFINQPFGKYHIVDFASNLFRNFNIILKWGEVENLFKRAKSIYVMLHHSWKLSNNKILVAVHQGKPTALYLT